MVIYWRALTQTLAAFVHSCFLTFENINGENIKHINTITIIWCRLGTREINSCHNNLPLVVTYSVNNVWSCDVIRYCALEANTNPLIAECRVTYHQIKYLINCFAKQYATWDILWDIKFNHHELGVATRLQHTVQRSLRLTNQCCYWVHRASVACLLWQTSHLPLARAIYIC